MGFRGVRGPSRPPQAQGLGTTPGCTAGGAPRRGPLRSGPLWLPAGPGVRHSLASSQLWDRPDTPPPTSRTPATQSCAARLRRMGGYGARGQSRAVSPPRVNYSWGAWACSQDQLCLRLLRRSGDNTGEKFPEQSWPHFLFSQVSIEHLLDAWPLDWGCS